MDEIGKVLPAIFRSYLQPVHAPLAEFLQALWPRVVGQPLAQHCRPVAFESGTLTLASDCSGWAAQLRSLTEEIRAEVNSFLGRSIVKKLRIRCVARLDSAGTALGGVENAPPLSALPSGLGEKKFGGKMTRRVKSSSRHYSIRNGRSAEPWP